MKFYQQWRQLLSNISQTPLPTHVSKKLLKASDFSNTSFRASVSSQHEIYPDVLQAGELVDKGDHLELASSATVTGAFLKDEGETSTAFEFVSTVNPHNWLRIEADDEGNHVATLSDGTTQALSLRDVAQITLRANEDFPVSFLDTVDDDPRNDELFRTLIKTVWDRAGMLSGYLNEANALTKVIYDAENARFVHHHIEHTRNIDVEKPETLDIHYQRIIPYPELGSEEVYHLSLRYIDAGHHMETGARKIIRAREEEGSEMKKYTLTSARITFMSENGTVKELDLHDPEVMKLFVDSFEELLDTV